MRTVSGLADHPGHSTFWKLHPQWHLSNGALDYERPEVRELYMKLIEEVCSRYDLDGLELDFLRFWLYFRPGHEQEGTKLMTAFVKKARVATQAAAKRLGHSCTTSRSCSHNSLDRAKARLGRGSVGESGPCRHDNRVRRSGIHFAPTFPSRRGKGSSSAQMCLVCLQPGGWDQLGRIWSAYRDTRRGSRGTGEWASARR